MFLKSGTVLDQSNVELILGIICICYIVLWIFLTSLADLEKFLTDYVDGLNSEIKEYNHCVDMEAYHDLFEEWTSIWHRGIYSPHNNPQPKYLTGFN